MAHVAQERYSKLVDAKLRKVLVTKDGIVFNNKYEGNPKAGSVKIPVRDTEVAIADYDKSTGTPLTEGSTTYITLVIDKDKAVNELIDGYDAASVPDNVVADRLDSAAYSIALQLDTDGVAVLESQGTAYEDTTATTPETVYDTFVDMKVALNKNNIPTDRRFALISADVAGYVLKSPEFIKASALGDAVVQSGAVGKIAGFTLFESNNLSADTEIIAGHPDWCSRVPEWAVPVHLQDLNGSGKYIGASAVQGRKIYAHKVTKAKAVIVKKFI